MLKYDWNNSGFFKEHITLTCVGTITRPRILCEFGCNHRSLGDVDQVYELDSDGVQRSDDDELVHSAAHAVNTQLFIFADEANTSVVSVYVFTPR